MITFEKTLYAVPKHPINIKIQRTKAI